MRRYHQDHPKREAAVAELARLHGLDGTERLLRQVLAVVPYRSLITELVERDRRNGDSMNRIAMRYGVSFVTVRWLLEGNKAKTEQL